MGEQSLKTIHTLTHINNRENTCYNTKHMIVKKCALSNFNINYHLSSKKYVFSNQITSCLPNMGLFLILRNRCSVIPWDGRLSCLKTVPSLRGISTWFFNIKCLITVLQTTENSPTFPTNQPLLLIPVTQAQTPGCCLPFGSVSIAFPSLLLA